MELKTSPVRRRRNVIRREVDGSIGGIWRTSESRCRVASIYEARVGSLDVDGCELRIVIIHKILNAPS
jgi:hypothetical protein